MYQSLPLGLVWENLEAASVALTIAQDSRPLLQFSAARPFSALFAFTISNASIAMARSSSARASSASLIPAFLTEPASATASSSNQTVPSSVAGSRLTEDNSVLLPQPARLSTMMTVRTRLIHLFFICLPSFMNLW